MLGNIMNALAQPQNQQMLGQVVGSLMGGSGGGGSPANQLLGGLEQVMGGKPGAASPAAASQAVASSSDSPLMGLLGPIASSVASQAGISPAVATTVAATAMHYLVSSHPAAGGSAPMNLGNVMQQVASGQVSPETLHSSGMVNAVVHSTGLSQQQAVQGLNAAFTHMSAHVDKERLAGKQKAKRDDN